MDEEAVASGRVSTLVVLVTGVLAAITLPGHAPGLNWILVAVLVAGVALSVVHDQLDRTDVGFVLAGALLMAFFLFRSAPWLLALDLIAALGLAAAGFGQARSWLDLAWAPLRLVVRIPPGLPLVGRPAAAWVASGTGERGRAFLRGGALGAFMLVMFGTLFMSADPAFASLAERFLLPEVDVGALPLRILVGLVTSAVIGGFVLLRIRPPRGALRWGRFFQNRRRMSLTPAEWITAVAALDALFLAFVLVQLTVLFGGHRQVLETTGLTYAQYARGGFFQLVAVAFLTLAVIAGVVRFGEADQRERTWMKLLLGGLCALTLVILASAMKRMNLYEEVYGFTRLRLLVDATILWLAGMFALVMIAGAVWKGAWLPRAALGLTAVAVLGLNLVDPDALIAERNIGRLERTGNIDLDYLATLSPDAVPVLVRLEHPQGPCVLDAIGASIAPESSAWSFNVARRRARAALQQLPEAAPGSCPALLGL